jgi:hypothetical protein
MDDALAKKSGKTAKVCGNCKNFKSGRCTRKDKKRSPKDEACGSFDPRA